MDPDHTMTLLRAALAAHEWHDVSEHIYNLNEWTKRGGFAPQENLDAVLASAHVESCRWTVYTVHPFKSMGAITSYHYYDECASCGALRWTGSKNA